MTITILTGDCREKLAGLDEASVNCIVTSPPYFGLRNYDVDGQIGLETTPDLYVAELVAVARELKRVLRDDGTFWLNLGDSYASKPNGSIGKSNLQGTTAPHAESRRAHGLRKTATPPGIKHKDLIGIPWMVAFALRADGWYLRKDIIWHKLNPMPESVTDRPTSSHEYVFLLSKRPTYYYDHVAVREIASVPEWEDGSRVFGGVNKHGANAQHGERTTGRRTAPRKSAPKGSFGGKTSDAEQPAFRAVVAERNLRDVWSIASQPFPGAHFATFPPKLIEPCIKAGCPAGGVVLDPFFGAGTTGLVADRLGRNAIGIELNPAYAEMAAARIRTESPLLADVSVEVAA